MDALKKATDLYKVSETKQSDYGNHSIVLIGGGTGVGKASSILSFTATTGEFVVWISLGSASLHTEKFWRAFSKTLKRWSNVLVVNLDQEGMPTEIKEIGKFTTLLNQTASRAGQAILVIDGYQLLAGGPVKNLIENIRVNCAVGVTTILISDKYVDISGTTSLMTSRRSDQIIAFTKAEIKVYYTALNIAMDDEILDVCYELTGGWVQAILQIGKYLPRGEAITQEHVDQAINLLYQYFRGEFHSGMKPELRQNLILLSMLNGFALEMVLELTTMTADECTRLYMDHIFCYNSALNQTCIHKLYHQYLVGMQNELPKKTRFAFLRKAAAWYDQHDMLLEAVSCYTACNEYDAILPVLGKRSVPGFNPEQCSQIARYLEVIPKRYLDEHPLHRLYLVFFTYFAGEREVALDMQQQLYDELNGKARNALEDRVLGELHVSKAYQSWIDMSVGYYKHIKAASELLPSGSAFLDVDEFHSPIGSVLQFHELQPDDLLRAKEICLKSAPYTKKVLPRVGDGACYLAVAEAHLYRGEFDGAIEYANLAAAEGARTQTWGIIAESCYILQRINMAVGDLDDILSYGQLVIDYYNLVRCNSPYSIEHITKFHDNVYFGLYHLLDSFADVNPLIRQNDVNHINLGRELYVHAIYKVYAQRQYNPALTFIDKACQVSQANAMFFAWLKLVILKAVVHAKMDRPVAAAKSLLEAYNFSRSNDIVFSFMEFGEEMLQLLDAVAPHLKDDDLPREWREHIAVKAERYQRQRSFNTWEYLHRNPQVKPDRLNPLTKQEYNALKFVSMGKTTEQVAQIMQVNQATIYLYLSRAYKKLGVERKEQAVEIAIVEGILNELK